MALGLLDYPQLLQIWDKVNGRTMKFVRCMPVRILLLFIRILDWRWY